MSQILKCTNCEHKDCCESNCQKCEKEMSQHVYNFKCRVCNITTDHCININCTECGFRTIKPHCKSCKVLYYKRKNNMNEKYCRLCNSDHYSWDYCIVHKRDLKLCSNLYQDLCVGMKICPYHKPPSEVPICLICGQRYTTSSHNCSLLFEGKNCDVCGDSNHKSSLWCYICKQDVRHCVDGSRCKEIFSRRKQNRYS